MKKKIIAMLGLSMLLVLGGTSASATSESVSVWLDSVYNGNSGGIPAGHESTSEITKSGGGNVYEAHTKAANQPAMISFNASLKCRPAWYLEPHTKDISYVENGGWNQAYFNSGEKYFTVVGGTSNSNKVWVTYNVSMSE